MIVLKYETRHFPLYQCIPRYQGTPVPGLATKHIAYFKTPHKCGIMIAIRFRAIGENTYGNTFQGMAYGRNLGLFF